MKAWRYDEEFSFLSLNLNKILNKSTPGKVACIWHIERVQRDMIKSERTQIHFLATFSLLSSSSLLKVPNKKQCGIYHLCPELLLSLHVFATYLPWAIWSKSMHRKCIKKIYSVPRFKPNCTLNWLKRRHFSHFWQFQNLTTEYISNIYKKLKKYNLECRTIEFGQALKSEWMIWRTFP